MLFWNSLAFSVIQQMLAIWSLVPLPFLNPAWTSGSSLHVILKPSLEDFEHNHASMGDECNCLVVWTFFNTALLGNWDEDWPFPVLWPLLGFPDLYLRASSFRILSSPAGISSPEYGLLNQSESIKKKSKKICTMYFWHANFRAYRCDCCVHYSSLVHILGR